MLAEAQEFADALPEERLIARLFWGDIDAARRLTGLRPAPHAGRRRDRRARCCSGCASPSWSATSVRRVLPGHGGKRLVDRLAAGEADAVAAELADGRIDARALERNGELVFTGW